MNIYFYDQYYRTEFRRIANIKCYKILRFVTHFECILIANFYCTIFASQNEIENCNLKLQANNFSCFHFAILEIYCGSHYALCAQCFFFSRGLPMESHQKCATIEITIKM